ncbi:hypothetical protein ACQKP1_15790 [Allorhizobium sp. NPDC080224]|uniref:hypothetical protein n=1 Tax=Allorhizobium sp. NPDC080224 TaxID=3390547 RepID=UPI003D057A23
MNTNLLHNIINILLILIPALEVFDWTPFFSQQIALQIVGGLGLAKILINLIRDGVTGLAKQQPPVQ